MQNSKTVWFHTSPNLSVSFPRSTQHCQVPGLYFWDILYKCKHVLLLAPIHAHTHTNGNTRYIQFKVAFFIKAAEIYPKEVYHSRSRLYFILLSTLLTDTLVQSFSAINNDVKISFYMWFFTGATKNLNFLGEISGNKIAKSKTMYIVILVDIVKLVNLEIVTGFSLTGNI